MKEIDEMHGRGHSARGIARDLGLARNTVLRCLISPEAMLLKHRPPRRSRLDPYTEHIDRRLAEGWKTAWPCTASSRPWAMTVAIPS